MNEKHVEVKKKDFWEGWNEKSSRETQPKQR